MSTEPKVSRAQRMLRDTQLSLAQVPLSNPQRKENILPLLRELALGAASVSTIFAATLVLGKLKEPSKNPLTGIDQFLHTIPTKNLADTLSEKINPVAGEGALTIQTLQELGEKLPQAPSRKIAKAVNPNQDLAKTKSTQPGPEIGIL